METGEAHEVEDVAVVRDARGRNLLLFITEAEKTIALEVTAPELYGAAQVLVSGADAIRRHEAEKN
jgi:hypothetical protein